VKSALSVWWDGALTGALRLDKHGDMSFAYDESWLADPAKRAISISLPKRAPPFGRRECRPFFAGLLPEESVREVVARALGISKGNDFAMLKALGGDVAGALGLWPAGETPPVYDGRSASEPLGDNALVELLDTLPRRPFLAGREGLRLSLAGAQSKLPVVLIEGRVALPAPGQPTTHILKPPIPRFAGTTENEAFVMRLAAELGLSVAPVEPRKVKDRSFLLVTRYDRAADGQGNVRRLHQEDFCQALGIAPENKYAAEGGPTFKTGFELVRSATTRPAVEILKLLDAAIFNLVAGNADAHGKNFSLLYNSGDTALAPLYDLMCTAAYSELSAKPAMKIANAASLEQLSPHTWQKFANDVQVGFPLLRRRVGDIAAKVLERGERVALSLTGDGFDRLTLVDVSRVIAERAARIVRTTV
jgi:serine/threonine-protein kinase HipA